MHVATLLDCCETFFALSDVRSSASRILSSDAVRSKAKFYNWRGEIFPKVLDQLKISSSLNHIVGYFKFRRQTPCFRSLRAYQVMKGVNAANVCLGIACAAPSNSNMETHTYDYSFWTVTSGSDE